jgi:hypothetical protein
MLMVAIRRRAFARSARAPQPALRVVCDEA